MCVFCAFERVGIGIVTLSNYPGAYTRGENPIIAKSKLKDEVTDYCNWLGIALPADFTFETVQEKTSDLDIKDADSDVIFDTERLPFSEKEYFLQKEIVLKSAEDFLKTYNSVKDKNASSLPLRKTFYGFVPRTADEMYIHTKNVNSYYFGEIGIHADNGGDIVSCHMHGFEEIERRGLICDGSVYSGQFGEEWSLRKVMRRFIWHDRIHKKAMLRHCEFR